MMAEPPRLHCVTIQNFRSLHNAKIDLSPITCLVGHNNSGKSSLMIALSILRSGEKLAQSDFYDPSSPVVISAALGPISENQLTLIDETARDRIRSILIDKRLHLVRRYTTDGKSSLLCKKLLPIDTALDPGLLHEALKGKQGAEVPEAASNCIPALREAFADCRTQKAAKQVLENYVAALSPDQLELKEAPLPTGIDNSIISLLPEVLYIPAVQDISDALKTKEAATFGKLLKLFAEEIESTTEMQRITKSFVDLGKLLNKTKSEDGTVTDERIPEVRDIENQIVDYLREQFPTVTMSLEIPPPELKTIFGNAQILINDGMESLAETKGDGIKRALMFSLIRTFVEKRLKLRAKGKDEDGQSVQNHFLFLFEEPELYLHPQAQLILYRCLTGLAGPHQVCVSTHSPYFLHPSSTGTFIRMKKGEPAVAGMPPAAKVTEIGIHEKLDERDSFQFLCYENNAAAFFAEKVLLVEGDSEEIFIPGFCRAALGKDLGEESISIIQAGGKGTIARMRKFFELFEIEVHVLVDLDALLDGFDKLGASREAVYKRNKLIKLLDTKIAEEGIEAKLKSKKIKKVVGSDTWQSRWSRAREICEAAKERRLEDDELVELDQLWEKHDEAVRYQALFDATGIRSSLIELLDTLREEKIYILSDGAIESYYPPEAAGQDKPSMALNACALLTDQEAVSKCGPRLDDEDENSQELVLIAESLFKS